MTVTHPPSGNAVSTPARRTLARSSSGQDLGLSIRGRGFEPRTGYFNNRHDQVVERQTRGAQNAEPRSGHESSSLSLVIDAGERVLNEVS